MRLVAIVVVLVACGETRQVRRWPEHRRQKDEQIVVLERKAADLEDRVRALETALQRLRAAPATPAAPVEATPAALPSPAP